MGANVSFENCIANRFRKLHALLTEEEKWSNVLYHDTATPPKVTGGVGHNFTDNPIPGIPAIVGHVLTDEQVSRLFEVDLTMAVSDVRGHLPWTDKLTPARFDALASLSFQLGIGGLLKFKKMLSAMQRGNWASAERELWNSRMAKQIGDGKGKKEDRMDRLAAMILHDEYPKIAEAKA